MNSPERSPLGVTTELTSHLASLLVDAVDEYAIYALGPDGTVTTWNRGAQRIKGYTADEIIGQNFSVFFTPDDVNAGKPARELAAAAAQGQSRDEGWRVRKDGSRFWANVTLTAIVGEDGRLEGYAKITRDDTDRRRMDEQVRRLELLSDRERIAAAMHETIVHRIFEASLTMEGALRLISNPTAVQRIRTAVDTLDATLKQIRTIVLDLDTSAEQG
jgi:PAS domain S-box-containing protein